MLRRLLIAPVLLSVACGPATPSKDAGTPRDAGPTDSARVLTDAGGPDVGAADASADDAGAADTGAPDTGTPDAGPVAPYDPSDDWARLTDGVSVIDSEGALPSSLVVHGETAFGVIFDEGARAFVGAARAGAGRVVVFGHEAYLGGLLDNDSDVDRLVDNAIRWTARPDTPTVGALSGFSDLLAFTRDRGYRTAAVTVDTLDAVDVLVVPASAARAPTEWGAILAWVEAGGGLIVAGQAWYWSYSHEDTATAYPANALLNRIGLTYTPYSHVTAGLDTVPAAPPGPLRHARDALARLSAHVDGETQLSLPEQQLAVGTVTLAVDVLPVGPFAEWFDRARDYERTVGPVVIPADQPLVRDEAPLEALAVAIATKLSLDAPAERVTAHPMAAEFPGEVDPAAPRVQVQLTIDGDHEGLDAKYAYANPRRAAMRSTGAYAAPGDTITVQIPAALTGAGLGVQVGAHTDTLWGKDEWSRYPRVVKQVELQAESTALASGLGGPIYVTVPAGAALGPVAVTLEGVVPMARFELGTTTVEQWSTARDAPAPWAELASARLVMTVPAEVVRGIDDPQPVLRLWDEVLDADAALSGFGPDRPRRERFVFDRQISAGWMHSGYPLMAHLASVEEATDLARLQSDGSWGLFHELGHNHQWRDWVLPGTTEANVNLFSVYAMEQVLGRDRGLAHAALDPATRAQRLDAYLATGPDFAQWTVWTALEMYLQLQEAFGWAPFTDAFIAYRGLTGAAVPGDDPARIDAWLVQMSEATGRDLSDFFVAWGHPVSAGAIADVAHLPPWTDHPLVGR